MKAIDVKTSIYIEFNVVNNNKDDIFKIDEHIRISNYKIVFAKGYTRNESNKIFVLKSQEYCTHGHVISDISNKKIVGTFYEKELQKIN